MVYIVGRLNDYCRAVGLAYQSQDLGMTLLSENDYLAGRGVQFLILAVYALLELEHHRTCGIDKGNSVPLCGLISGGRLTVGPKQDLDSLK